MFNHNLKREVMHISKGHSGTNHYMHDVILGSIDKEKDLGVVIRSDLEVSEQKDRKLKGRQTRY